MEKERRAEEREDAVTVPLIKEYESIIKSLHEQLHSLQNRLAISEDSLKRHSLLPSPDYPRLLRKSETEIQELGAALRTYEDEQTKLKEKLLFWEGKAALLEGKLAQSLEEIEDLEVKYKSAQLSLQQKETQLKHAELTNREDQLAVSKHTTDIQTLQEQITRQNIEITQLKATVRSLELQNEQQEELIKAAGKKAERMRGKVEALEGENARLGTAVQTLEMDRKKLLMKWQSLVQKNKGEDRYRSKIKELEDANSDLQSTLNRKNIEESDLISKLTDRNAVISTYQSQIQRLFVQLKVLESEKEVLSSMNKDLSIRLSRVEEREGSMGEMNDTRKMCDSSRYSSPEGKESGPRHLLKQRSSSSFSPAPLPEEHKAFNVRTKTPSQGNSSRGSTNPPSPLLSSGKKRISDLQDFQLGAVASTGRLRISRRTASDREQWKI